MTRVLIIVFLFYLPGCYMYLKILFLLRGLTEDESSFIINIFVLAQFAS